MAKEILRRIWCDKCLPDTQTEAEEISITIDGDARMVDLCKQHRVELVEPLHDLIVEHGQPIARKTKKTAHAPAPAVRGVSGSFVCPTCSKEFDTAQGAGAHRSRAHGYRAA